MLRALRAGDDVIVGLRRKFFHIIQWHWRDRVEEFYERRIRSRRWVSDGLFFRRREKGSDFVMAHRSAADVNFGWRWSGRRRRLAHPRDLGRRRRSRRPRKIDEVGKRLAGEIFNVRQRHEREFLFRRGVAA